MAVTKCEDNETPFSKWVSNRLSEKEKNSVNIALVGETGSGKTYAGLKLCEFYDKEFNTDRIAFSVEEVVKLLDSKESGLKRGSSILLEETGVSAGARDALTNTNKTLSYIYQTIRVKGYFLVLTLPNFTFLDKHVRELQHCIMETQGINFRKKKCKVKPLFLQVNQTSGKVYKKYLRYYKKGVLSQLRTMEVGLASKQLIKDYEKKKDEYLEELRVKMEDKLKVNVKDEKSTQAYTSAEYKKYLEIKEMRDKKETWPAIATHFKVKQGTIQMWFSRFNPELV